MKNQKTRGAYYTPPSLANFIFKHVYTYLQEFEKINILEPSVGDGVFIESLSRLNKYDQKNITFTAIEKYISELRKAEQKSKNISNKNVLYSFINEDFLKFQDSLASRFQLIIGNPPYIKKNRLSKFQRNICKLIHKSVNLDEKSFKNIWSGFLIRCTQLLDNKGVLAFVLPSDLLQVKFSKEIKEYLISQFKRVEIFTFNELLFEQIGQDTILIFCYKNSNEEGVFYSHIKNINSLESKDFFLQRNDSLTSSDIKWTHNILSNDEISFLLKLKSELSSINKYCESKPGIVTAANNYFIINSELEKRYNLEKYSRNIIQKGSYVNGKVIFTKTDFRVLEKSGKPTKVICFSDRDKLKLSKRNKEYLGLGLKTGINDRYKCSIRDNWFVIPNIGEPSEGFFFKRCHRYPKILLNDANILVTDSAYKITMKENYSIKKLVYSFYNSLTLAFAELEGRYYGDGVLELTPREFKNLPIPFVAVNDREFKNFRNNFENKPEIDRVLISYDEKILCSFLKISTAEIQKIQAIRIKLLNKRLRIK